ncbi:MAG: hypothetical protein ACM3SR_12970 [Ignavibacteriales bacterium]
MAKGNRCHIRIKDVRGLRKFLTRLLSERYRDEIEGEKARDLAYIGKVILEAFKQGELEQRLENLEKLVAERSQGVNKTWT